MKIKKEMKREKRTLPLYIIHNLKTLTTKNQVEDYIENTLLKSATFSLIKGMIVNTKHGKKNGVHYNEVKKEENEPNKFFI